MSTLRSVIADLASKFAQGVLDAVRSASLEEILSDASTTDAPSARRGPGRSPSIARAVVATPAPILSAKPRDGRIVRRSAADIARVVDAIIAVLREHPKGLRSEEIRAKLGLAANEIPRPISDALLAKRIQRRGEKRATTYFVGGAGVSLAKAGPRKSAPPAKPAAPAKKVAATNEPSPVSKAPTNKKKVLAAKSASTAKAPTLKKTAPAPKRAANAAAAGAVTKATAAGPGRAGKATKGAKSKGAAVAASPADPSSATEPSPPPSASEAPAPEVSS